MGIIMSNRLKEKRNKRIMEAKNLSEKDRLARLHKRTAWLSFLLPIVIMLIAFGVKKIYPFGDRSFLSTDLYHQYMPFFSEFIRAVKEGDGLSYTWNVGIGSNFMALYVYYLASPFHWLGFLAPEEHLMEFLTYLMVFKTGLCGLTSFIYLSSRGKKRDDNVGELATNDWIALFFSLPYALSGFMAAYNWNIMWIDCVILLPLIVLGLERLVKEGKPGLYCVTLGLSIFTNYYISIMICIFLVMYFIYLYCTEKHPVPGEDEHVEKHFWAHMKPLIQFALYSILAAGMASILLIPEVCAIMETDFGDVSFPKKFESYFSMLDVLARHCVSVTPEKGLEHWPNIYSGAGVFLFVPFFVFNKEIPVRRRFGLLAIAGTLLLGFSTNVFNFIWHGLNYPDSLPARQSFIYTFVLLIMCHEACCVLQTKDKTLRERIVRMYIAAAAILFAIEKFVDHEDFLDGAEWLTLLFVTIYAMALYFACVHAGKVWRVILICVVLVSVVTETAVNTCKTSISNVSRDSYLENLDDYGYLYDWISNQDDRFYRVEKFTRKTKNDGTLVGYPTASVFSSTMNSAVMDLYERFGMRHSKVYYGYDGATAFTSALLNVDYIFGESSKYENSLYKIINNSGKVSLYNVENTLPFGYVAPKEYDVSDEGEYGLILQNQMVNDLGVEGQLFVRCDRDDSGDGIKFTAPQNGIYYSMLTASGTKKLKATGGYPEEQTYQDLKNNDVVYLGYLNQGSEVVITNNDSDDKSKDVAADVYRMDEDVLKRALAVLSENHLENVSYDSTHIEGRIKMEEEGRLILSVPYEKGWKISINGNKVDPSLFGDTLMAFDLEPGDYELSMRYVPHGKWAGIAVSIVSIGAFAALMIRRRRQNKEKTA